MFPNEQAAGERLIIADPVVMEAKAEDVRVGLSFSFSTTVFAKPSLLNSLDETPVRHWSGAPKSFGLSTALIS
jgi:hypothetical protein